MTPNVVKPVSRLPAERTPAPPATGPLLEPLLEPLLDPLLDPLGGALPEQREGKSRPARLTVSTRRLFRDAWRDVWPAAALALTLLIAWELACRIGTISPVVLPAPTDVLHTVVQNGAVLAYHGWATTLEVVAAFAAAIAIAVVLASLLILSPLLHEAVYPYIVSLQTVPKVALAPLFTVWLSIGFTSRFAIAVFISLFSILVPLLIGLRSTPPSALNMARCSGAGDWQTLVHVRFPYALRYLMSGLKIASTTVVLGVVVGEFITSDRGLGYLIVFSAARFETSMVLAAVLVLCVVGLVLYGMTAWLSHVTNRWMGESR